MSGVSEKPFDQDFEGRVVEVNLLGSFLVQRGAIRALLDNEAGEAIVNKSSISFGNPVRRAAGITTIRRSCKEDYRVGAVHHRRQR